MYITVISYHVSGSMQYDYHTVDDPCYLFITKLLAPYQYATFMTEALCLVHDVQH